MAKCVIRVDYGDENPYLVTIREIWKEIHRRDWGEIGNMVVRLQVDDDEPFNTLLLFDGSDYSYYWEYDWFEGQYITILGFELVRRIKLY